MISSVSGGCADHSVGPRRLSRAGLQAVVCAGLLIASLPAVAQQEACAAPQPVCAARASVFAVSGFDPYGSAVRIAPDLLVTNRHLVADEMKATVHLGPGRDLQAEVVPSSYSGDLILLRVQLPVGPVLATSPAITAEGKLFTVGQDIGTKRVRVFPEGRALVLPDPAKPAARLHHNAYSQPGTSGGALLNEDGRLVAIVASGGEGRFEGIPVARLEELKAKSGPEHAARHAELGKAYRDCIETLDQVVNTSNRLDEKGAERFAQRCTASENRQLFDVAAQVLGKQRMLEQSVALFERALDKDPNAINTRLSMVVTLLFAQRYKEAVPHVSWLVGVIPEDPAVHRYAVQIGKFAEQPELAQKGLELIAKHNPAELEAAKRFIEAPPPPRR